MALLFIYLFLYWKRGILWPTSMSALCSVRELITKRHSWDCHWPLLGFWEPPTPTQPGPSETSGFVFPFRNLWLVWLQLQWIFVQSFMLRTSEIPQQTIEENQIMWRRPANNVQNSWLKGCKTNLGNGSIFKIWVSWLQIWGISYVIMWSGELRLIWVGGFWRVCLFVVVCFLLFLFTSLHWPETFKKKSVNLKEG